MDDQNPGLEAPSKSKRGRERGGSKGDVRGKAMKKRVGISGSLRGRRSEEMTQSNTSHGCQRYVLSPRRDDDS